MQLQQNLDTFTAAGIKLFAISYDPVEVLAKFAEEFGITFPLLYDEGSAVMRQYGIMNTMIRPEESAYYGIPYPGIYAVGEDGRVTEKSFFRYYRVRPSAQSVLKDMFDIEFDTGGDPYVEAAGEGARVSAVLASDGLVFMQRDPLYVRIALNPGLHIYRAPVPEGFIATEVTVTGPDLLAVDQAVYPGGASVPRGWHPARVRGPRRLRGDRGADPVDAAGQRAGRGDGRSARNHGSLPSVRRAAVLYPANGLDAPRRAGRPVISRDAAEYTASRAIANRQTCGPQCGSTSGARRCLVAAGT